MLCQINPLIFVAVYSGESASKTLGLSSDAAIVEMRAAARCDYAASRCCVGENLENILPQLCDRLGGRSEETGCPTFLVARRLGQITELIRVGDSELGSMTDCHGRDLAGYFFSFAFSNAIANSPVGCGGRFCGRIDCGGGLSRWLRGPLGVVSA